MKRRVTHDGLVTENISLIENVLLGEYDARGQYYIATEITNELINLPKKKKNSFNNSMFCVANDPNYGEIVFELAFQEKRTEGEVAISSLYVLETINKINGYLQNTLKTKLGDFRSNIGNFIEESYKFFNIKSVEDEDNGMDNEEAEESLKRNFMNSKRKLRSIIKRLSKDKYLDAYGKYFTERMSILTKLDNEFSTAVLDSFNSHYNMIENDFLVSSKDYKMLNELLDKSIDEFSGTNEIFNNQEEEFNNLTEKHKTTFINTVSQQLNKDKDKALAMLDKKEKESIQSVIVTEREHYEQVNKEIQELKNKEKIKPQIDKQTIIKEVQSATQKTSQDRDKVEKIVPQNLKENQIKETPQVRENQPKEYQFVSKNNQIPNPQIITKEIQTKETQVNQTQLVKETQVVRENQTQNIKTTVSSPKPTSTTISSSPLQNNFGVKSSTVTSEKIINQNQTYNRPVQPKTPTESPVSPRQSQSTNVGASKGIPTADTLAKLRAQKIASANARISKNSSQIPQQKTDGNGLGKNFGLDQEMTR